MRNPLSGATYANVAATLSLLVALGGTSYAAVKIGTNDLEKNAVTAPKIKNGAVKTAKLKPDAVTSARIKDGSVTGVDLAPDAVGSTRVADGSLVGTDLAPNAVDSTRVADDSLTGDDVKESTLGQVPSAASAADIPDTVLQELPLLNGWWYSIGRGARFARDATGAVHLFGGIRGDVATSEVFARLPAALRPGHKVYVSTNLFGGAGPARVVIAPDGYVSVEAFPPATFEQAKQFTSLDGVSFFP